MKKRFTILFFLSILLNLQSKAQFRWGYKAGIGLASVRSSTYSYSTYSTTNIFSYQVGLTAETPIKGEDIVLQPALLYCKKGTITSPKAYLDLPLNVIFKTTSQFQFGVGPVISFLVYDKEGSNKFIDLGGNVLLGYNLTEVSSLNFNYTFGLVNAVDRPYSTDKNVVYSVSLVQFFK
jgi:hypothetical protein